MAFDSNLLKNSVIFCRNNWLEERGKEPKLAVYRSRLLVIVSYKTNNFFEKITQLFKRACYSLLKVFGVLKFDEVKISEIKTQVIALYQDLTEKYNPLFQQLVKGIEEFKEVARLAENEEVFL